MLRRVARDGAAPLELRDVKEPGLEAVGRGPEIVATRDRRADGALHPGRAQRHGVVIALQILAWIIIDRLPRLGIDAARPGDLADIGDGLEELTVHPVEAVLEAVPAGMDDELAILAIEFGVDEDVGPGLVIVPGVVRIVLVIPADLACRGVDGEGAAGVEIVAGA